MQDRSCSWSLLNRHWLVRYCYSYHSDARSQQTHALMGYLCNIRRQLGRAIDCGNEIVSLDLLGESREASNDQYKTILPMILLMETENGFGSV